MLAVVERLGGPVHLVGHSFGGLVCRRAALERPRALASLTLLASGPRALTGPRVDVLALLPAVLAAGGLAAVADASEAMSAADPLAVPVPDSVRAFLRSRWLATSGAALIGMAEALRTEPDRVLALRRTGLPVLVLHGEADDAWSPAEQREMAERLGAAYAVVPGARHSPAVEAPEPTAQALLAFWSGAWQAGRTGSEAPAGRAVRVLGRRRALLLGRPLPLARRLLRSGVGGDDVLDLLVRLSPAGLLGHGGDTAPSDCWRHLERPDRAAGRGRPGALGPPAGLRVPVRRRTATPARPSKSASLRQRV